MFIKRGREKIFPNGNTEIIPEDILYVLSDSLEDLELYIKKVKEVTSVDILEGTVNC